MSDVQVTFRAPDELIEKIHLLAERNNCSNSDIIRATLAGSLEEVVNNVQYVEPEQGRKITEMLTNILTDFSSIRTDFHRIGVNYNQEVRLLNAENRYKKTLDVGTLLRESSSILKESVSLTKENMEELMTRFENACKGVIDIYTRITHSKNGAAALKYCQYGIGHNGKERNLLIGSVGLIDDEAIPYETQMAQDWCRKSGRCKNEVRRIIASFSPKELDPNDPDSPYIALEIAKTYLQEVYPGHTAAIFIQNDGIGYGPGTLDNAGNPSGGKLHMHMIVNNVNHVTGKGIPSRKTHFEFVEQTFDEVAGRFITLDFGTPTKEKMSQAERALTIENQKSTSEENKPTEIWKQYMKQQIASARNTSTSMNDFLEELELLGVTAKVYGPKVKKTGKVCEAYIKYELTEVPDDIARASKNTKFHARDNSLGYETSYEFLMQSFEENKEKVKYLYDSQEESKEASLIKIKPEPEEVTMKPTENTKEKKFSVPDEYVQKTVSVISNPNTNTTSGNTLLNIVTSKVSSISHKTNSSSGNTTTGGGLGKKSKLPDKLINEMKRTERHWSNSYDQSLESEYSR